MPLSAGTKLGPYEIFALIGAGGMGEVYRAKDPRMGRDVAIKISAERFSDRFSREVHAVAALNHPNICTLYDVGPDYLVMELVEGPTLAGRIRQGAFALDDALPIAGQIAEALEAAHDKGIVHRDLKPANIKIRADGRVKVLDFGLAKMAEAMRPDGDPDDATQTLEEATSPGLIMGTAAYMAPEQARGAPVDKRADIWAFGVVLYEMLTATRLFKGDTAAETMALILSKEPDWNAVPAGVRPLLRRCLMRDPKLRLRDIGDAMALVEKASPAVHSPQNKASWVVAAAVAVLLAVAGGLYWRTERAKPEPFRPLARVDVDLGKEVSLASAAGADAILSPDGSRLAFVSQGADGQTHLSTRRVDQSKVTELSSTEGAYAPFFSPDGQWLGFFARGKLKKIPVDGGEAITLADAPSGRGASWGEGGNIVAALDTRSGLSLVPSAGGTVTQATEFDRKRGEATHRWPQVLPGGRAVLFTASTVTNDFDAADIEVTSLADRRTRIVLSHAGSYARFLSSGHLVYVSKGTLFAAPFDLDRLEVRGMPVPVLEGISYDPLRGFPQLDISRSGSALYRTGSGTLLRAIRWIDGDGKTETLRAQPGNYQFPRLSPDGNRLAAAVVDGANSDIWVYDLQRDVPIRLPIGPGAKEFPVWTPDGRHLIFQLEGGGAVGMYWTSADGAGKPEKLIESRSLQSPGNFSSDGARLVYGELNPAGTGSDVRVLPVENRSGRLMAGRPELFLSTPSTNPYPAFSPDGRWIAYSSTESGVYQVYVRAFPAKGSQWQVSNSGGMMPVWSPARREIFYRTEDQRLMAASYTIQGDSFMAEKPRLWFAGPLANLGLTANFDLAPDGRRFAVLLPAGEEEPRESRSHMTLLLNFFDDLRRRVPPGK